MNQCICKFEELERGDRLYIMNQWEAGYDFKQIKINYCPVCGKQLPSECDDCETPNDCRLCEMR